MTDSCDSSNNIWALINTTSPFVVCSVAIFPGDFWSPCVCWAGTCAFPLCVCVCVRFWLCLNACVSICATCPTGYMCLCVPRPSTGIPVLHSGSHFRHGLLQLMIHTIDPLHDGSSHFGSCTFFGSCFSLQVSFIC